MRGSNMELQYHNPQGQNERSAHRNVSTDQGGYNNHGNDDHHNGTGVHNQVSGTHYPKLDYNLYVRCAQHGNRDSDHHMRGKLVLRGMMGNRTDEEYKDYGSYEERSNQMPMDRNQIQLY